MRDSKLNDPDVSPDLTEDAESKTQAHINRQFFELLVTILGIVNEMAPQISALRALQERSGITPGQFDQVVAFMKKQKGHEAHNTIERVYKLVSTLRVPRQ